MLCIHSPTVLDSTCSNNLTSQDNENNEMCSGQTCPIVGGLGHFGGTFNPSVPGMIVFPE